MAAHWQISSYENSPPAVNPAYYPFPMLSILSPRSSERFSQQPGRVDWLWRLSIDSANMNTEARNHGCWALSRNVRQIFLIQTNRQTSKKKKYPHLNFWSVNCFFWDKPGSVTVLKDVTSKLKFQQRYSFNWCIL